MNPTMERLHFFGFRALRLARYAAPAREDRRDIIHDLSVHRERIAAALRPYWEPFPGADPAKYLHAEEWIFENCLRARWCGLHRSRTQRVLDLGCGMGFFLLAAEQLGNVAVGIDVPDNPLYNAARVAFGFNRVEHAILPTWRQWSLKTGHVYFPELPPADLITSWMTTFHDGWLAPDWDFFLHDHIRRVCHPATRIVLELAMTRETGPDRGIAQLIAGARPGFHVTRHAPNLVTLTRRR